MGEDDSESPQRGSWGLPKTDARRRSPRPYLVAVIGQPALHPSPAHEPPPTAGAQDVNTCSHPRLLARNPSNVRHRQGRAAPVDEYTRICGVTVSHKQCSTPMTPSHPHESGVTQEPGCCTTTVYTSTWIINWFSSEKRFLFKNMPKKLGI